MDNYFCRNSWGSTQGSTKFAPSRTVITQRGLRNVKLISCIPLRHPTSDSFHRFLQVFLRPFSQNVLFFGNDEPYLNVMYFCMNETKQGLALLFMIFSTKKTSKYMRHRCVSVTHYWFHVNTFILSQTQKFAPKHNKNVYIFGFS